MKELIYAFSASKKKGEKLRTCIHHFNKKKFNVRECNDDVAKATFTNRLEDKELVMSLYLDPPENFNDIMDCIKDHMLANEALHSSRDKAPKLSIKM